MRYNLIKEETDNRYSLSLTLFSDKNEIRYIINFLNRQNIPYTRDEDNISIKLVDIRPDELAEKETYLYSIITSIKKYLEEMRMNITIDNLFFQLKDTIDELSKKIENIENEVKTIKDVLLKKKIIKKVDDEGNILYANPIILLLFHKLPAFISLLTLILGFYFGYKVKSHKIVEKTIPVPTPQKIYETLYVKTGEKIISYRYLCDTIIKFDTLRYAKVESIAVPYPIIKEKEVVKSFQPYVYLNTEIPNYLNVEGGMGLEVNLKKIGIFGEFNINKEDKFKVKPKLGIRLRF